MEASSPADGFVCASAILSSSARRFRVQRHVSIGRMRPAAAPVKQSWPESSTDVKKGPDPGMAGIGLMPSGTSCVAPAVLLYTVMFFAGSMDWRSCGEQRSPTAAGNTTRAASIAALITPRPTYLAAADTCLPIKRARPSL